MPSEREIQHAIRVAAGRPPVAIWRNNVGQARMPDGSVVKYGLCVGSSDLIGLQPMLITPEHVGNLLARFVAIEVKTRTGRPTPEQLRFIELVRSKGGLAGIARSPDDALAILRGETL
jgi:hypothetical protein